MATDDPNDPDYEEFHEDNNPAPKTVKVNYPPNSNRSKMNKSAPPSAADPGKNPEGKPKLQKIVKGEATERKKSLGRRFAETFKGDDVNSVGHYILTDIVAPAIKAMISEAVSGGTDRLLFGSSGGRSPKPAVNRYSNYTNYNRVSGNVVGRAAEPDAPKTMSSRARANHDFAEILIPTRGEAEAVLEALGDAIAQYEVASVADFYDLVGYTGSFPDQKWGWLSLAGSNVQRVGQDGYVINFPKTQPID